MKTPKGKDLNNDAKKDETDDMVTIEKKEHEKLKEAVRLAEEYKDRYLREHAELDNIRKRLVKEKEEFLKYANEDILSEMLYVVDNFDRALEHMNGTQKVESVLEGIKMIQKQFHLLLEQKGVKRLEAVGEDFDPAVHEAIAHVEAEDEKDGKVVEEIQAGYMLNDRLLRPAAVKIGKKKDNNEKQDISEEEKQT